MGSLSKIAPICANCPQRDTCDHKRMVMVGYLEQPSMQEGAINAAQPLFVGKIGQSGSIGASEPILKSIADALNEDLSAKRFMNYGA